MAGSSVSAALDPFGLNSQEDLEATEARDLTRAWSNEKFSPEILPFQQILVDNIMEQLTNQKAFVEENRTDNVNNAFVANLYLMEIERIKYLLRSYLKARLAKIDRYGQYILGQEELKERLSKHELDYVKSFVVLKQNHFMESGMGEFRGEAEREQKLIRSPNPDVYVFCRVLEDVGEVILDKKGTRSTPMTKGAIFALKYESIAPLIQENKVELI